MANHVESIFTRWEFEDSELFQAYIYSDLQIKAIQNELAIAAQTRATLAVNPDRPVEIYRCEQEYYRGKIESLQFLLALHERTVEMQKSALRSELAARELDMQARTLRDAGFTLDPHEPSSNTETPS